MIWPIPMSEKVYIVTLHKHEDLEEFYNEMEDNNFHLVMKRPMSRNTHYKMNEEQAKVLRQDPRVWDVQLPPEERGMTMSREAINYDEYTINGNFWKGDTVGSPTVSSNDRQWGHIHCAGNSAQRAKGSFGLISEGGTYEQISDTISVFNNGRHVDVVICDDPVSAPLGEWGSPYTGQTRFIQYDWYSELNTLVGSIDDDGVTLPSGSYSNYFDNATNTEGHGTHVAGTVAGRHYGWAQEANIYSMQVLSNQANTGTPVPDLLIFDYLRAFHRNKAVNPDTGIKNPTITNHSWSYNYDLKNILEKETLDLSDIISINYRGTVYSASNPNPSGWNFAGLEKDFGFAANKMKLNADNAATNADVEDAISEGIVIVAAAGNNNFHCVYDGDVDYYNSVTIFGLGTVFYNRGSSPGNSPNAIAVGSLSNVDDFRRSTFSNFGPVIEVFAPGNNILSAYDSSGLSDGKYLGGSNYFYPIQGTSMASPQVAGVLACLATGKERFTQGTAKKYLKEHSILNDMTFDIGTTSGGSPTTYNITTTNSGFSYVLNGTDRNGSVSGTQPTVTVQVGDTINFNLSNVASNHPFRIRVSSGGSDVSTPAASGQGSTGTTTVSWTPNTPGNYVYQCQFHGSMVGNIIVNSVPSNAGTFADNTCSKNSPNSYLHAKNPRADVTGMILEQVGNRSKGLTFPRVSVFNRPSPQQLSKTFTITVTNIGASHYNFLGGDRVFNFNNSSDPTVQIFAGDIIEFNVSASGHPFLIKTAATTGTGDQLQSYQGSGYGVLNNGITSGTVTLYTSGLSGTTLYYICQFHSSMSGSIIIS